MARPGCCSNRRYRLRCVHSKGVLLLMAWAFFWYGSQLYGENITLDVPMTNDIILYLGHAMFLVFPIVGWIADSCLGRYKIITASIYIGLASWILQAIAYTLFKYSLVPVLTTVIWFCGMAVNYIGLAGFLSSLLPFVIDQLLGASGEELSAAVYWWYWSVQLSFIVTALTTYAVNQFQWDSLFYLLASLLCLLFLVVTHLAFKNWLVREAHLTNPINHIAKVLNYARKNKYPRNRSALTYWEEDYPSRLDLGKDKYGGPFSEEEVEDVKTVLRLLPLLVFMFGLDNNASIALCNHYTLFPLTYNDTLIDNLSCNDDFLSTLSSVTIIPFYQLVLYPCFYKYIPTMLKRMSTGLLLLTVAQCGYAILELVGHSIDRSVHCAFVPVENSDQSQVMPISIAFTLIPQFLNGLGYLLLILTSLEFIVAQTPTHMRALMIGLRYAVYGLVRFLGDNLYHPFSHIPSPSFPSCGFYYFLTKIVILGLMFPMLMFLSKRYRLRERNIPVNFHMFAENYYDKYIDIERQLERQGLIT